MIFASETASASGGMGGGVMLIWIVALVALMYFMMIRPQKKEQKRMQAMLSDLAVGDAIVTNSGFYGIVIDITEEDVDCRVQETIKIAVFPEKIRHRRGGETGAGGRS